MVERPRHVLGRERATVHRRQVLPLDVRPQRECPGLAVLAGLPRLGQVALHDVGLGGESWPLLRHEQPAVEERRELLDAEADVEVGVQAGRVFGPYVEAERAAIARSLAGWLRGGRGRRGRLRGWGGGQLHRYQGARPFLPFNERNCFVGSSHNAA